MSDWSIDAVRVASERGLVVRYPAPDELFIDIDSSTSLATFERNRDVLKDTIVGHRIDPSPSGKPYHFHIRVKLVRNVRNDAERIGLQALLGSDTLHEALSWRAANAGHENVTLFFEKPDAETAVVEPVAPAPSEEVAF